ncbi:putative bifunctional diguanylate cyclase/phosphodiesterase [Halofilum ochraceum]|uniref:putative bifunctional diguanylate cyclase/phosphodiesterase n=1 Tax=Halofilum ochraceum TaxID=1611323 RepID=UPI0008372F40|nr:GGDEF domain-containing phosphodiesterase [Halofilum ochraceum]
MTGAGHYRKAPSGDEAVCLASRGLRGIPGIRRSLTTKLTFAALLAVTPFVFVASLVELDPSAYIGPVTLLVLAAGASLAGFALMARCLVRPIAQVTEMVRGYRMGKPLQPPSGLHFDEIGSLTGEIVQTLREANAHLVRRAHRDAITGAFNREGLSRELAHLLERVRSEDRVAVAVIEIRELSRWEVALGSAVGETVRRAISDRIRPGADTRAAAGVISPYRFAFVTAAPAEVIDKRLDDIWQQLQSPIPCGAHSLIPTVTMGIAWGCGNDSPTGLLHAAETASRSSRAQTGSARVNATESSEELRDIAKLSLALEDAINQRALDAHFQPRIGANSLQWVSAEALARWEHPEHGAISPGTFIPMAADSGRIADIGRIMLDRAVAAVASWNRSGMDLTVSVNVDAEQLVSGTLEDDVARALERHGVAPESLELEITETSLLANLEGALAQITALRARGVHFALDDFGTGYSSLGYLGRLPVDRIKIDRSFVRGLDTAEGCRIVRAITDLARSLSLKITAEGIETEQQARRMREFGCDELQGFLYARALPAHAIVETNRRDARAARRDALLRPIEAGIAGGIKR